MRLTTPATTSFSSRGEERKPIDLQAGKKATQELFGAISMGTRMLEFKDMLKVGLISNKYIGCERKWTLVQTFYNAF